MQSNWQQLPVVSNENLLKNLIKLALWGNLREDGFTGGAVRGFLVKVYTLISP